MKRQASWEQFVTNLLASHMHLVNVWLCILLTRKINKEQKQMDVFILLKMKTHLILSADDVIPDWSAARDSGGKLICLIIQGVKSIQIKFANLMANSLSRRDGTSFIPWVNRQPYLLSPLSLTNSAA